VNNGHTIQVPVPPGSTITVGDHRYEQQQLHLAGAREGARAPGGGRAAPRVARALPRGGTYSFAVVRIPLRRAMDARMASPRVEPRLAAQTLAFAGIYAIVGRLGLAIAPVHLFASLVWAPTGVALAVLLRGGFRFWPGIALGAFLVNASRGAPVPVALAIAAGNTFEALLGAWLIRRAAGPGWSLERLRGALAFIALGALLSTTVSASVGVSSLYAAGLVPGPDVPATWRVWWLGDLAGALVVASLLLAWSEPRSWVTGARRRAEAAALGAVLIVATSFVFFHGPVAAPTGFLQACMLMPLLIWAAVRFAVRGATAAIFLASVIAVAGTAHGLGPFVLESLPRSLLHQQAFMAIMAAAMLIVGAVTAERAAALRRAELHEAALTEADRRKNEFLGVLSHELRNPLAPIQGSLNVLRRAPPGSDQAARATAVIERQTRQLTRLVDDLLDVTRISRGVIQLQRARVDLAAVVRDVVEDHRALFASRSVALELRVAREPLWVEADAARVTQIVGNLLHNASKFTSAGGRVTVSAGPEAGRAVIRVADDGVGISPGLLPHVFEPFTQADSSLHRASGGLGLGLTLVKGLVEMHGGSVSAASDGPGKGAAITISLPLDATAAQVIPARPGLGGTAAHRRVLVIEDKQDAADTLRDVLELDEHVVEIAHSGRDGIEKARAFHPDVVLCDIGLPEMDGYEVARTMRADPDLSGVALVAVSGYAQPEDVELAREAGFDAHLAKPPNIDTLERALSELGSARPGQPAPR
jgi:signal transduction histidine kinase/ActR/RegA family two-component response regulator